MLGWSYTFEADNVAELGIVGNNANSLGSIVGKVNVCLAIDYRQCFGIVANGNLIGYYELSRFMDHPEKFVRQRYRIVR